MNRYSHIPLKIISPNLIPLRFGERNQRKLRRFNLNFYSKSPKCKFREGLDFKLILLIDNEQFTIGSNLEDIKKGLGTA